MKNLKGVNTPEQVYQYVKAASVMPVATIYYLTYDGTSYQFNYNSISFKDDDKGILTLNKVSDTEYFYAFVASEKGDEWMEKNKRAVSESFYNTFAPMTSVPMDMG